MRSFGSLKGSLFQLRYSDWFAYKLMMPFSQEAQLTGPTYFFVSMALSSVGIYPWLAITKSYKFFICTVTLSTYVFLKRKELLACLLLVSKEID